nr:MAG TPA: 4Fe-4S single cluster domain protein [Caudoviricetes sp.]
MCKNHQSPKSIGQTVNHIHCNRRCYICRNQKRNTV